MRRLPVYVLIDTSGSMYGEPIEAVKNGLSIMLSTLNSDPYALETAYLSIITFNDTPNQILPLTEISSVKIPDVYASGCTALRDRACRSRPARNGTRSRCRSSRPCRPAD